MWAEGRGEQLGRGSNLDCSSWLFLGPLPEHGAWVLGQLVVLCFRGHTPDPVLLSTVGQFLLSRVIWVDSKDYLAFRLEGCW